MADAQARREARRRKILQNSENRLKLITGEHNGTTDLPLKTQVNCITKEDDITKNHFSNVMNHTHYEKCPEIIENNLLYTPIQRTPIQELNQGTTNNPLIKYTNLLLILVAVLSRVLLALNVQFSSQLALPFILVESAIMFLNRKTVSVTNTTSMSLVNIMLIFNHRRTKLLNRLMQLIQWVEAIGRDFAVYMFTFVWLHVCLENYF